MMRSQNPVHFPLPVLDNRFTSTELDELLSFFQPADNAANVYEPREPLFSSPSGSDDLTDMIAEEMDEKRKKRKISNRESAKRSRLRKKRHTENMTTELNRLKAQNREYNDRLTLMLNRLHIVKTHNELIRFESTHLIQRHADLNRVLKATRYSQNQNYLFNNNLTSERFVNGNGLFDQLTTEMRIN